MRTSSGVLEAEARIRRNDESDSDGLGGPDDRRMDHHIERRAAGLRCVGHGLFEPVAPGALRRTVAGLRHRWGKGGVGGPQPWGQPHGRSAADRGRVNPVLPTAQFGFAQAMGAPYLYVGAGGHKEMKMGGLGLGIDIHLYVTLADLQPVVAYNHKCETEGTPRRQMSQNANGFHRGTLHSVLAERSYSDANSVGVMC